MADRPSLIDALLALPVPVPLVVCNDGIARPEPPNHLLAYVISAPSEEERDRRAGSVLAQYAVAGVNCPAFFVDVWPPFSFPTVATRGAPWRTLAN